MKRKQLCRIDLSGEKPKIKPINDKAFWADVSDFPHEGKVWVEISTYHRKRTLDQNNTIHWYFDEIAQYTGMEMEDVKQQMAKKFLTVEMKDKDGNIMADPETGEVMTKVLGTSDLNTVEFGEYLDKIRLWCISFLNFELPIPDKNFKLKFK